MTDYAANARAFLADYLSDDCPEDLDAYAREEYANDDPATRDTDTTFFAQAIRTLGKPKTV